MNMKSNLSQHPCENKCSQFNGEQCRTCLIGEDLGDDRHIENHVSVDCKIFHPDELKHLNRAHQAMGEVS